MAKKNTFLQNEYAVLGVIVLAALVLRVVFFYGMGISDSLVYSETAATLEEGIDTDGTVTLSTRLGLVLPTRLSFMLFGVNPVSAVLFNFIASLGSVVLVYFFAKLFFSRSVAQLSALLMAVFPLEVFYGTQLVSDMSSAFFMGLGVYLFFYGELRNSKWFMYLFSGVLIGFGYMIRESALLIALFFAIYVLGYKRKIKANYFLVPIGVLLIFLLELFVFFSVTGDPFFRNTVAQEFIEETNIRHNYFGRLDFPTGLFHYPYIILTNPLLNLFFALFGLSALYFLMHRKKETNILLLWFVPLLLYLSFGSAKLTAYVPFRAVDRYLSIIIVPAIILAALFILSRDKRMAIGITSFMVVSSLFVLGMSDTSDRLAELNQFYDSIKDEERKLYIDQRSFMALEFIADYDLRDSVGKYIEGMENEEDVLIAINKKMVSGLRISNSAAYLPDFLENPPSEWELVDQIGEIDIYHIK